MTLQPLDPHCVRLGKRTPRRYYEAPETHQKDTIGVDLWAGFDAKMPAEWESWLRHRREDPPTEQQVLTSLAYAETKKRNAAKLERKRLEEFAQEVRR